MAFALTLTHLLADGEGDRDIYRTMVQVLLEQAHGHGALIERQQETIRVTRDEYRRFRQRVRLSNGRRHDEDR